MTRLVRRRVVGALTCVAAIVVTGVAWAWAGSWTAMSTDNAYVRGDTTSLAAKVGGYVIAVEVEDNQAVSPGDVLFRISDRDFQVRLAQAVANVQAAQARLTNVDADTEFQHALIQQAAAQRRSALAELALAERVNERRRKLIRTNAASQAAVDESDTARARAEAGVAAAAATQQAQEQRLNVLAAQREAALAALAQAEAAQELAQIDLDNTVVRAPIAGIVGNRQVRLGRLIAPGTPLLDIVPVNDVWLVANFKETQVANIRPGQRARITIDGFPSVQIAGVVDSFAPGSGSAFSLLPADNATGNFVRVVQRVPVKIRFVDNPLPGRIVPGLSARVEIMRGDGP